MTTDTYYILQGCSINDMATNTYYILQGRSIYDMTTNACCILQGCRKYYMTSNAYYILQGCRIYDMATDTYHIESSNSSGVEDADFLLYVAANNTPRCNSSIAYATYCQLEVG